MRFDYMSLDAGSGLLWVAHMGAGCGCGVHLGSGERGMTDPLALEIRRQQMIHRLRELRGQLARLDADYGSLQASGILVDTEGIGALTTPAYCIAGAREVFEETMIELDAAADALDRAGVYTTRLRPVVLE
ncbi:hypothetical protein [Nocardia sp. CA-120079]|uniref:hypothetical protein n=1 Tax=Nocardia sp. CA-120079 TaxID=3239974 RepID=UPI003D96A39E